MAVKYRHQRGIFLKVVIWYFFLAFGYAIWAWLLPQQRGDPPPAEEVALTGLSVEKMAELGLKIVRGADFTPGMKTIGKGQCPLCHIFSEDEGVAPRCPLLKGEEKRSHMVADPKFSGVVFGTPASEPLQPTTNTAPGLRFIETEPRFERYKRFKEHHKNGEPNSGIVPHAKTGGQYLIESEYCPNCFVVEGYGVKGSNDMESPMPIINKPPIELSDNEIVAVVTWLQSKDDNDFSKVTAQADWEDYFGKKLGAEAAPKAVAGPAAPAGPPVALATDTPEQIVTKMQCFVCHKIPTIAVAKTGIIGPLLIEKENALKRIKSKQYKEQVEKAIKEGKFSGGGAFAGLDKSPLAKVCDTPKCYVMQSIMHPDIFLVPGFQDDMLKDFGTKFTFDGLNKIAEFLLTLGKEEAIKDNFKRLPQEQDKDELHPDFKKAEAPGGSSPVLASSGVRG